MKFLPLILFVIYLPIAESAFASETVTYLKCDADPGYVGKPEIVINKKEKKIYIVPIEEGLPLSEDDTTLTGKLVSDGKVLFEVSINKYTLRYTLRSIWDQTTSFGQCAVQQKKL